MDEVAQEEIREEKDLWENRRKMAWRAFNYAIAYVFSVLAFFAFAPNETVKSASEIGTVAIAVLGFFAGVVMAYIGAATYQDVKNK